MLIARIAFSVSAYEVRKRARLVLRREQTATRAQHRAVCDDSPTRNGPPLPTPSFAWASVQLMLALVATCLCCVLACACAALHSERARSAECY
jgi:hypothetical protein